MGNFGFLVGRVEIGVRDGFVVVCMEDIWRFRGFLMVGENKNEEREKEFEIP